MGNQRTWSSCITPSATCITQHPVGEIERHVQRLPDARSEEREPEIVTGGREQEHDAEAKQPSAFIGKPMNCTYFGLLVISPIRSPIAPTAENQSTTE